MGLKQEDYLASASKQQKVDADMEFLAAPVKSAVDKFQLLPEFLKVKYKDVWIGEPSLLESGINEKLSPHRCRLSDIT
ncbi:nuclear RNA polymerase C2 [Actinidia rufa]|uniref:Nuclear RNA polymerase C2 n=1 Tax=Actinidia rufa TaxID=165716 RepID=A0A7J0EQ21_9ERIC|nr:nuclear RNA polymerase C2 [Actinidia rufa]